MREHYARAAGSDILGNYSVARVRRWALAVSVCLAICMSERRSNIAKMEPDQDGDWCESCDANTVASCLVNNRLMAGLPVKF